MDHTFDTPEPVRLYVELGSGRLELEATDTDRTTVAITGPRAEEFQVTQAGRQLSVIAPRGRFFGHDSHQVRIVVPEESDVATKTGSADSAFTGRLGVLQLKTGSGDVEIDEAAGPVVVESGSGDIEIHEVEGDLRIKSGSGDVELGEVAGTAGISTGSGDVVVGVARAATVVKTGSGDLEVKRSEADVSLTTASGDLTVRNAPRGKVSAKNVSGDVYVGIPAGTPVWTDISSVTGTVVSKLPSTGKPAEGQDHVELRATTVSGDIRLMPVS
jgi:DUF4097 and DUF4098 domain-containing protein YvlB